MKVAPVSADAMMITDAPGLDAIHVYWVDVEPWKGYVTITCYGSAWTAYFGGMSGQTIREFFASADTGYLVSKMGITPHLKGTKRDHAYLGKIIDAVRRAIQEARAA